MTPPRLALRNLVYHWRGNFAVLLGVVVGTAVLTGALLVGDSLRGSLRQLTLERLGWVDQALVSPRLFRAKLADSLPAERAAPALMLQATADRHEGGAVRRIMLMGVDNRFGVAGLDDDGAVLSAALAQELKIGPGDAVTFRVQKTSNVPRESLLGQRDDAAAFESMTFNVAAVLPNDDPAGRFSLQPSPETPRNAFVPLAALQEKLTLRGEANALFVGGPHTGFNEAFRKALDLEDWGLRLTGPDAKAQNLFDRYDTDHDGTLEPTEWHLGLNQGRQQTKIPTTFARGILEKGNGERLPRRALSYKMVEQYFRSAHGYLSLESRQLILEPALAKAALEAADEAGLRAAPTLVYLCKLSAGGKTVAGIVAALDPKLAAPLGPFLPDGKKTLADDEIGLVDWTLPPTLLPLAPGTAITLTFKPPEHQPGKLPNHTARFRFAGVVPLSDAADDPDLTPPFPGITDKELPSQWKLPFEDKTDKEWSTNTVRQEYGDPLYWGEQRTTPKAYINLAAGQKLWSSRFGDLTSIRLAPREGTDLAGATQRFRAALLQRLDPEKGGMALLPVKRNALEASAGGTDFAGLFVGFSFFLIAAALLLVGLLFRLNLDRRGAEIGILLATGYRHTAVRRLLLIEGSIIAVVGTALGLGAAIGYSALVMRWFSDIWPGGTLRSFLRPHVTWMSLGTGFGASLVVSLLTILWAVRGLGKVSPRALLAGQTGSEEGVGADKPPRWSRRIALGAGVLAVALLACGPFIQDHEAKAGTFFGAGAMLLTAALAALSAWMRGYRQTTVAGGSFGVERLGIRNAARNPLRSMLTAGLLASAAFLIVAVEAFRQTAAAGDNAISSSSGGFNLLAESELPLFHELSSDKGRDEIRAKLIAHYRQKVRADQAEAERRADAALAHLKNVESFSLRVRAGDDASCLNLYQPQRPRLFGVPATLVQRGGFVFSAGGGWSLLERAGEPIAAFGEENTVVFQLKSGLGKTLTVPDEKGTSRELRIDGLLHNSVFQSGLLISEANFLKLYPDQAGYNFFLIAAPPGEEASVKEVLEMALADRGMEVTTTAQRLEAYLAVENTYLSTFQALGGLGLLLGTLGLAVVLLRGVWERRAELALLRALGYRRGTLGRLVLAENGFLLLVGLAAGTVAALLAVAPHLLGGAATVPWAELAKLLGLVLVVGLLAGALAVAATLRAPLIPALRRE